ncbi:MAG TPA: hypothetical protein VMG12_14335, partial [Polyangiaceae bacterium]|nr:hypothetical protein [Polyangiaceae bacterium]
MSAVRRAGRRGGAASGLCAALVLFGAARRAGAEAAEEKDLARAERTDVSAASADAAPEKRADPPPAASEAKAASSPRVKRARRLKPLDPPSDAQVDALERFQAEANDYEQAARDYRGTLTLLVRHHYEEQRRRILEALDQDIDQEQDQLSITRDEAIRRLEAFVARYSGPNADPSATPDAMFRLAALYEEKARGDTKVELAQGLLPAMALYRRIVDEFPAYQELAGVAYYLGHAYTDAGRLDEGQQAWRSLVCHNNFPLVSDANDEGKIQVTPLRQDHDPQFWADWYNRNPIPLDQLGKHQRDTSRGGVDIEREELSFDDPYRGCEAIPQQLQAGQEPRYVAEAWWQLGNFHFDQL